MVNPELLEADTHTFIGTVASWNGSYGVLLTDSGVRLHFMADEKSKVEQGMRIAISARKFKPLYRAVSLKLAP